MPVREYLGRPEVDAVHLRSASTMGSTVTAPSAWLDEAASLERRFCVEIRHVDPADAVEHLADSASALHYTVTSVAGGDPGRILEVGSGYGFGLAYALQQGLDVTGVEPGATPGFDGRYEMARDLLEANGLPVERIIQATGEALPFADGTFDMVASVTVLEHVTDVAGCLAESVRVASSGGLVVHELPNFNTFAREGHFAVPWLPYLLQSKCAAKRWVRAFGREPWYVDELNFITVNRIRSLIAAVPGARLERLVLYPLPRFAGIQNRSYAWLDYPRGNAVTRRARVAVARSALKAMELAGGVTGFRVVIRKVS